MSIKTQIERIINLRNGLREKLVSMNLADITDSLSVLVEKVKGIVSYENTFTEFDGNDVYLPAGYYPGGMNVTMSESDKNNLNDENIRAGVFLLNTYGTFTSDATARSSDILLGKTAYAGGEMITGTYEGTPLPVLTIPAYPKDVKKYCQYIDENGNLQNGEMLTYIAQDTVIDCENTSHTIPEGYHTGEGRVKVVPVEVSANPSEEGTVIYAQSGEVISRVTVLPIPERYKDVSDTTLTQNYALEGYAFYDSEGMLRAGSMVNRSGTSGSIDGISVKKYTIPHGYHDGSGSVTLTDDIENALKEL